MVHHSAYAQGSVRPQGPCVHLLLTIVHILLIGSLKAWCVLLDSLWPPCQQRLQELLVSATAARRTRQRQAAARYSQVLRHGWNNLHSAAFADHKLISSCRIWLKITAVTPLR
jgi:hypothetical protein